jgi:hypothetical protein
MVCGGRVSLDKESELERRAEPGRLRKRHLPATCFLHRIKQVRPASADKMEREREDLTRGRDGITSSSKTMRDIRSVRERENSQQV